MTKTVGVTTLAERRCSRRIIHVEDPIEPVDSAYGNHGSEDHRHCRCDDKLPDVDCFS